MENYHNMIKKFFHKGNVMPKISVIIPVYNVEQYLPQCLDSLKKQTLSDLEFICINDGSVDGSLDTLQTYAAEDYRFVIINQKNRGQSNVPKYSITIVPDKILPAIKYPTIVLTFLPPSETSNGY